MKTITFVSRRIRNTNKVVFVSCSDEKSMIILKEKVKSINYLWDMDYADDSKNVLKNLLEESME